MIADLLGIIPVGHGGGHRQISLRDTFLDFTRWLRAEPRDVIAFNRRVPAASPPPGEIAPGDLLASLAAWQQGIARRRTIAIARRWLIGVAVLGLVLAVIGRFALALPLLAAVAIPFAAAAILLPFLSWRAPSLAAIARLADSQLALNEQVATALEVAEGQAGIRDSALSRRLEARAAALVEQARHDWVARLTPARSEWASLVVLWTGLVMLLSMPHPALASQTAQAGSPVAAIVPAASAAYQAAFVMPAFSSSHAQRALHMQIAVLPTVVSNPAGPASANRLAQGFRPAIIARSTSSGRRSAAQPARAGATSTATKSSNGGGSGALPALLRNPSVWQQSGAAGHSPVAINSTRNRELPQAPNSSGAQSAAGQPQGATNRAQAGARAGAGAQSGGRSGGSQPKNGTSGTSNSRSGTGKASAKTGRAATGAQAYPERYPGLGANPYLGLNPLLGRTFQTSRSSANTRQGTFTGRGTPGGLSAGNERGSAQGQRALPNPVQAGQGRQLSLQSAYSAGGQSSQTTPGKGNSTSGQLRTSAGAQQGGAQTADYVSPDANYVAIGDRAIVSRYFAPQSAE